MPKIPKDHEIKELFDNLVEQSMKFIHLQQSIIETNKRINEIKGLVNAEIKNATAPLDKQIDKSRKQLKKMSSDQDRNQIFRDIRKLQKEKAKLISSIDNNLHYVYDRQLSNLEKVKIDLIEEKKEKQKEESKEQQQEAVKKLEYFLWEHYMENKDLPKDLTQEKFLKIGEAYPGIIARLVNNPKVMSRLSENTQKWGEFINQNKNVLITNNDFICALSREESKSFFYPKAEILKVKFDELLEDLARNNVKGEIIHLVKKAVDEFKQLIRDLKDTEGQIIISKLKQIKVDDTKKNTIEIKIMELISTDVDELIPKLEKMFSKKQSKGLHSLFGSKKMDSGHLEEVKKALHEFQLEMSPQLEKFMNMPT